MFVLLANFVNYISPAKAQATDFTKYYVFLDRITTSTTTGGTVCVIPATASTEASVQVIFPGAGTQSATDFGVNGTASNWTVTSTPGTNVPSSIAGTTVEAWPSIATATAVSGATVTFPSGDLTVAHLYCFHFTGTNTLSTPTSSTSNSTGTVKTRTSGPADIDSSTWGVATVSGSGSATDQVSVTASVGATFSFSITGSQTCALGTLVTTGTPSTCSTAPVVNVSTNAKNGFQTWIKSANGQLQSTTAAGTPITSPGSYDGSTSSLSSSSGYGLDAQATSGSPTIADEYQGSSTAVGHLDTFFQSLAYKTAPVSGAQITLNIRAEASATTNSASDYADTLTVVGSGSF